MKTPNRTQFSLCRRLLIAYLISQGVNTTPKIQKSTGMPHRTIQDTIKSLSQIWIIVEFQGPTITGKYVLKDWGPISKSWIKLNLKLICDTLELPEIK
ncbi:helix-turn-helix domain-containing protein [Aliivibrio fischeri]|uniref:helix-turn-helix domain-containing protein n=1 Tax=Aliivibrio fischeri TaxID=668 RepID=UPI0007C461CB|nr:helix-turn-helix domain-containing protein [Aliivibrio fischeri]